MIRDESGEPRPNIRSPTHADMQVRQSRATWPQVGRRDCSALRLDSNQRVISIHEAGDLAGWLAHRHTLRQDPRIEAIASTAGAKRAVTRNLPRAHRAPGSRKATKKAAFIPSSPASRCSAQHDNMKAGAITASGDDTLPLKPLTQRSPLLAPELDKAFNFTANFPLRPLHHPAADSERGDFFSRHRDNQSPPTADRRFALTLNLNTPSMRTAS